MEFFKSYASELRIAGILGLLLFLVIFLNNRIERLERGLLEISQQEVATEAPVEEARPLMAISFDLPDSISFAGEPAPLHRADVREQLDKEMQINIYFHSNTIFLIKRANTWLPQFQEILRKNNIPDDFKYLPLIESALLNDISPRNAVGFWQIVKNAGKEFGLEITNEVDERYDPIRSTEAACKYLKKAYQRFGSWTLAAASYNRGMSGLDRTLEKQKVDSYYDLYLNEETARYVFRVLAIKQIVENPGQYGFVISDRHLYQRDSVRWMDIGRSIPNLVDFAREQGTNYKLLKRLNPWLRDDHLTVRAGNTYRIALPLN